MFANLADQIYTAASQNVQPDPYPRPIPQLRWSRPIHTSGSPQVDPYLTFNATPYEALRHHHHIPLESHYATFFSWWNHVNFRCFLVTPIFLSKFPIFPGQITHISWSKNNFVTRLSPPSCASWGKQLDLALAAKLRPKCARAMGAMCFGWPWFFFSVFVWREAGWWMGG